MVVRHRLESFLCKERKEDLRIFPVSKEEGAGVDDSLLCLDASPRRHYMISGNRGRY